MALTCGMGQPGMQWEKSFLMPSLTWHLMDVGIYMRPAN